jgi:two-component system response regulator AlgR
VQIVGSVGDGETALDQLDALLPDVLLLDINMPGVDGVSVAKRLAGRTRPQVIFCTAYEGYALKAFDLGAADYLLKPVRLERLRDALQRAQRRLADAPSGPTVWIHGRLRGGEVRIALDEVTCLIADEKYVCVHHRGGALLIEESLRQLEEAHPQQLIRLHRNCLVPPARLVGIKTLADGRVLARLDGSELAPEISRRNLPVIRKLLRLG